MLLQFSVENFKSFKDKAVLSLEASADKQHLSNVFNDKKNKILKTISIYGANASGKSNIIEAISTAAFMIKNSNRFQYDDKLYFITPFKFKESKKNSPSSFEFIFIGEDKKKYIYGFSATPNKIVEEYLYKYNTAKPSLIFERDILNEHEFNYTNAAIRKNLEPLEEKNTNNKLFLSTATSWNAKETRFAYSFFSNILTVLNEKFDRLIPYVFPLFDNDDGKIKKFTNKLLKKADVNISNYDFESWDVDENISTDGNTNLSAIPKKTKKFKVTTYHEILDNNKQYKTYELDLSEESKGTIDLFFLSPVLNDVLTNGKVLFFDEFGSNFHPSLVSFLIKIFLNKNINKNNAQLIFSTHDLSMLTLDYLRRDQFYFTEKSNSTGESDLFSLDEFSIRKSENIRKAYCLGRYGAIPNIEEEIVEW